MRYFAILAVGAAGSFAVCPCSAEEEGAQAPERPSALNTIYVEGLGPAGTYSLNYERRIDNFGLRLGFSYFSNPYFSMTTIPVGFNNIGIGNSHNHLELGGVATIAIIDGDSFVGDAAGVFVTGLVGYRYQPPHGGFNFRVGASPIVGAFGVVPWGYISFGGTFGGKKPQEDNSVYDYPTGSDRYQTSVAAPMAAPKKEEEVPSPTGFAGMDFSMTPDEARAICEGNGHSWTESDSVGACDSTPQPVGMRGDIQMKRCDDQYCQILFTSESEDSSIIGEVQKLKSALQERYGAPWESKSAIPQDCRDEIVECIREQRAHLHYLWKFPKGEEIKLRVGQARKPGEEAQEIEPKVVLLYKRKDPRNQIALEPQEAPLGMAGFEFSMSKSEAQTLCEEAGHTWSESSKFGSCSAAPQDVGLEGSVQLLACEAEFCQMLLTASPADDQLVERVSALKSVLQSHYGKPSTSQVAVPQDCAQSLVACIESQRAYINYVWTFPEGQTIKLRLGKKAAPGEAEGGVDHKIRLLYTRQAPKNAKPQAPLAL